MATRGDRVVMERQASVRLSLVGSLLGIALSACAAAVSRPHAPATDESRTLRAARPASTDALPELRSYARACGAPGGEDRARPADARQTPCTSQLPAASASAAERIHAEVHRRIRTLDATLRAQIAREVLAEAARARLDPLLVIALIHVESSFDPDAVSRAGAAGLMQVRHATMREVASRSRSPLRSVDPLDPVANIQAGVRYLAGLIDAFGDTRLALMAYNAGPGRIRRYQREGGVPERFHAYPERIARELVRLGGSLEPSPARATRAVGDAPAPPRFAAGPALERNRTHQPPPRVDGIPRAGPRGIEPPGEPEHGLHHRSHETASASGLLAETWLDRRSHEVVVQSLRQALRDPRRAGDRPRVSNRVQVRKHHRSPSQGISARREDAVAARAASCGSAAAAPSPHARSDRAAARGIGLPAVVRVAAGDEGTDPRSLRAS